MVRIAFALSLTLGVLLSFGRSEAASPLRQLSPAEKIIGCFAGRTTPPNIAEMHDCSGYWVTPRVLLWCLLEKGCSVLSDTIEDRATFDSVLTAQSINLGTILTLNVVAKELGPMPDAPTIEYCKGSTTNEKDLENCVLQARTANQYSGIRNCFAKHDAADQVECIGEQANNEAFKAILKCLGSGQPTTDKLLECNGSDVLKNKANGLRDCVMKKDTVEMARDCFTADLGAKEKALVECAKANNQEQAVVCLTSEPTMAKAANLVRCLSYDQKDPISCGYDSFDTKGDAKAIEVMKCIQSTAGGLAKISCVSNDVIRAT
jgi:hypothetical protein